MKTCLRLVVLSVPIVALLAFLCLTPQSQADCRKRIFVDEVIVKKEVVVAAVTPVVATFVAVPLYQAYAQPYVPAPAAYAYPGQGQPNAAGVDPTVNDRLDRLEKALTALIEQLNQQGGAPAQPGVNPRGVPPMPKAEGGAQRGQPRGDFATDCVSCHTPGAQGTKGPQGITLFGADGQIVPGVEGRMAASVYASRMPKGRPYDDPATSKFMAELDEHTKRTARK